MIDIVLALLGGMFGVAMLYFIKDEDESDQDKLG